MHEVLTSQTPFLELDMDLDGLSGVSLSQPEMDITLLCEYCRGDASFPVETLENSGVAPEGIEFVMSLMIPNPKHRLSATEALRSPWLGKVTNQWYEALESEFLALGVNLAHLGDKDKGILIKKTYKADIVQFLPAFTNYLVLLEEAVANGQYLATLMLMKSPSSKSVDDSTRGTLFRRASGDWRLATIKILLFHEFHVNARVGDGNVLEWAVSVGYSDTVDLLLVNRLPVDTSVDYQVMFEQAVKTGHVDVVRALIRGKPEIDVEARDWLGQTALQVAAGLGYLDLVKFLIHQRTAVNTKPSKDGGRTALQAAAKAGHIDIVMILLENEADVNAQAAEKRGLTALQAAAAGGHIDVVRLLLSKDADANADASYEFGRTALQAAAKGGHIDAVKMLLESKARVNAEASYEFGRTAFQAAAEGGHTDVVGQWGSS